jgi:DNA replication protein DnaC
MLSAAQAAGRMKHELRKYTRPALLILDELGFLPIDKAGADLLFQVISQRYEQGALVITSNRAFKDWPEIFNNDGMLTSAILDRLLLHAETILIQGKSFRMKEQIAKYEGCVKSCRAHLKWVPATELKSSWDRKKP